MSVTKATTNTLVKNTKSEASPFGRDRFGQLAESFARAFGTPKFIILQTVVVIAWITLNAAEVLFKPFDPYPFILLNLAFSTQAAYAAPLILLAQTRQADRDKLQATLFEEHRESVEAYQHRLLKHNEKLTEQLVQSTSGDVQLAEKIEELQRAIRDLLAR